MNVFKICEILRTKLLPWPHFISCIVCKQHSANNKYSRMAILYQVSKYKTTHYSQFLNYFNTLALKLWSYFQPSTKYVIKNKSLFLHTKTLHTRSTSPFNHTIKKLLIAKYTIPITTTRENATTENTPKILSPILTLYPKNIYTSSQLYYSK